MKTFSIVSVCLSMLLGVGLIHAQTYGPSVPGDRPPTRNGGTRQLDQSQMANIRHWSDRLALELEHLHEDIQVDLEGQARFQLSRLAQLAFREVIHFQRTVRAGASREHIVRDFREMDRQVHELLDAIRRVGQTGALQRGIARVNYADQQLHFALFGQVDTPDVLRELIARQAHALSDEAREMDRAAQFVIRDDRRGRQVRDSLRKFASEAEHFHRTYEADASLDHIRRDFQQVDRSWQDAVRALNSLRGIERFYLLHRAERVNRSFANLHRLLQLQTTAPQIGFRQ